jgi:hypothetical protein
VSKLWIIRRLARTSCSQAEPTRQRFSRQPNHTLRNLPPVAAPLYDSWSQPFLAIKAFIFNIYRMQYELCLYGSGNFLHTPTTNPRNLSDDFDFYLSIASGHRAASTVRCFISFVYIIARITRLHPGNADAKKWRVPQCTSRESRFLYRAKLWHGDEYHLSMASRHL